MNNLALIKKNQMFLALLMMQLFLKILNLEVFFIMDYKKKE